MPQLTLQSTLDPQPSTGKHYTFIDLFAGIGGFRFGFEPAGGTCVWSCEIDRHSRKTYSYNHQVPMGMIFPDVRDATERDIPDHDVLIAGFACFAKDTMVLTCHGYVPIQHLRPGTPVLTHKGRWRPIVHIMRRNDVPTREIHAQGVPGIVTTDEHPFYTQSYNGESDSLSTNGETTSEEWTKAKDLADHWIAQRLPPPQADQYPTDLWWLIGRYLAAGHRTHQKHNPGITIPSNKGEQPLIAKQIEKAGYQDKAVYVPKTHSYVVHDQELYEWVDQFGEYPATRRLNQTIMELEETKTKAMLDGFLSAKNHHGDEDQQDANTVTLSGKSLALELALLAQRAYGTIASVTRAPRGSQKGATEPNPSTASGWTITVPKASHQSFVDGQYGWKKTSSNMPTGRREPVWNISVQEDQSYIADGAVVHNCEPFSKAGVSKNNSLGKPHGFAHETRGTLFFEVIRILASHRPQAFLLENVPHLLNHDKGRTYATVKFLLEQELGYHTSHRIIDARPFVPQRRRRIFIAGHTSRDCPNLNDIQLPDQDQGPILADILHPQDGSEHPEQPYTHGYMAQVDDKYTLGPGTWQTLINHRAKHSEAGNGFGYSIAQPDQPTRTLTARYWKDGQEILVAQEHTPIPRRLTPRECSRLMGMPHLKIPVSDTQAYRQLGHSVVPPLVETLADFIMA